MVRSTKKWIDKKSATTFHLVHRPQTDPLIHDPDAPQMVFKPLVAPNTHASSSSSSSSDAQKKAIKTKAELEAELGDDVHKIRKNEGEAAQYGIYYDDTEYDYMQHLREFGDLGNAVIVETPIVEKKKNKKKETLDEALRGGVPPPESLLPKDVLPSEKLVKRTYQDQQDVPDAISGFQPDMDFRLREALEALEDDAFAVEDDGTEDLFAELTTSGEVKAIYEVAGDEYEDYDDEDGYASDRTARPASPGGSKKDTATGAAAEEGQKDWMSEFSKYKKDLKKHNKANNDDISSIGGDSMMSFGARTDITSASSRRRRRKGRAARSETSGYSMTSSSLFRTEGLTLLDSRFEKIEEEYAEDEEEEEYGEDGLNIGGLSLKDGKPEPETRKDFEGILDEFLDNYKVKGHGKRTAVRRGKNQSGLEELEQIRRELRV